MSAAALLAALTLAASVPTASPMIPQGATAVIHIPKPAQSLEETLLVLGTADTLNRTGGRQGAGLSGYVNGLFRNALMGALLLDGEGASLKDAGIDATRPITLSMVRGQWVGCHHRIPKAPPLALAADPREAGAGLAAVQERSGKVSFLGVADSQGWWRRGAAVMGDRVCSTSGSTNAKVVLEDARAAFVPAAGKASPDPSGALRGLFSSREGTRLSTPDRIVAAMPFHGALALAGFKASTKGQAAILTEGFVQRAGNVFAKPAQGKAEAAGLPALTDGMPVALWLDAALSTESLSSKGEHGALARRIARHMVPGMPADAREQALKALLGALTGKVRLAVTGVDGKQPASSIHQVRQAVFAQLDGKSVARVKSALAGFAAGMKKDGPAPDAQPVTGDGFVGVLSGKPVWFGIVGQAFYFGNDRSLLESAAKQLAPDGANPAPDRIPAAAFTQEEGALKTGERSLTVLVQGEHAANALRPVSLFDMANGNLFAGLFFAKSEAEGVIRNSRLEFHGAPAATGNDLKFTGKLSIGEAGECPCRKGK